MNDRLSRSVRDFVKRGCELASHADGSSLRHFMPDRFSVLADQRKRSWRAYWRAIFLQMGQEVYHNMTPPEIRVVDWVLQTVPVDLHSMEHLYPYPDQLPWDELCNLYFRLRETPPHLLMFAPVFGGMPPESLRPSELWPNLWVWPSPPTDPWRGQPLPSGLLRSPYQILQNALQAFPASFDSAWDLSANTFLTYLVPLIVMPNGSLSIDEAITNGMTDISKALVALRLACEGSWTVPSVLAVIEPFFGDGDAPIYRWVTAIRPPSVPSASDGVLSSGQFGIIAEWRRHLDTIPWQEFPLLPFVRYETIHGIRTAVNVPEQYVASNYIEYALVLWALTYGRSATETILNAWSVLELLFKGTTEQIKQRATNLAPHMKDVIDNLSDLRQSFGHGRMRERPRRLFGDEIFRIRQLLRTLIQKILTEVGQDPTKYGDRKAIAQWATPRS